MPLQKGKDVFGIAKQSGKGVIAANPYFAFGLAGGGLIVSPAQEPDRLTSAYLAAAGAYRSKIETGAKIETRAYPGSIGLLLLAALGDSAPSGGAPAVPAVLTTALVGANNDLTFLAKTPGTAGNGITVHLDAPDEANAVLSVDVDTLAITVNLATGSGKAITSTAAQVRAAINADAEAKALITASIAPGNSGVGVVTALVATNLAGGAAPGAGGTYTHVATLGDELDYFTIFEQKGDDTLHAVEDCKLDELEISWEENMPLKVAATFVGGAWSIPATFVATIDEMDTVDYFTPVGGTFKYDVGSDTPVESSVLGGKVTIKRSAGAKFYSGSIEPGDVFEGLCEVEVSLTVLPDDMDLWRTMLTGSDSGTAIQGVALYGSLEVTFVKGADSLKLECAKAAFLSDFPEADPEGGAVEMELAGFAYRVAGTPITATLVNTQATYAV